MNVDRITTVVELFGLLLVALGAGLIYVPAGVICAGLCMVLAGAMAGRR